MVVDSAVDMPWMTVPSPLISVIAAIMSEAPKSAMDSETMVPEHAGEDQHRIHESGEAVEAGLAGKESGRQRVVVDRRAPPGQVQQRAVALHDQRARVDALGRLDFLADVEDEAVEHLLFAVVAKEQPHQAHQSRPGTGPRCRR
ncbi:MAG: hypothetical protein M5U09_08475 [Gammaproteobacteria bacterium]|nr:hypothetical protein [Gammaproteobacteria bacterium]